ncbi:MAG: glycosyltransferase family 4 protein [Elusimicrobiota bacterium]
MTQLKICFAGDYLPDYHSRSGGADWAFRRIGELIKKGTPKMTPEIFYITIPSDKEPSTPKDKTPKDKTSPEVYFAPIIEKNFPKKVASYIEILKWYLFQFDPRVYFFCLNVFKEKKPDVVHVHRIRFLTFAVILAAKKMNIPVCFSVYDYWTFCVSETLVNEKNDACREFHGVLCWKCLPEKFVLFQKALLLFRRQVFDFFIKRIDKFIVLSNSSAGILKDFGIDGRRIEIIPLPYPEDFKTMTQGGGEIAPAAPRNDTLGGGEIASAAPRNDTVGGAPAGGIPGGAPLVPDSILYVGWLQKRKGLDVLLRAMAGVVKNKPSAKLFVIGPDVKWENKYRELIDALIKDAGIQKNIELLGPRPNTVVREYIGRVEMVVVPEQWENMSPVIVGEAMLCSKPVVGSRLGGIPEFISDGETGYLCGSSDPDDFAEKILLLLGDKTGAAGMGKKGRSRALEIFDEKKILKAYQGVYEGLADKKH